MTTDYHVHSTEFHDATPTHSLPVHADGDYLTKAVFDNVDDLDKLSSVMSGIENISGSTINDDLFPHSDIISAKFIIEYMEAQHKEAERKKYLEEALQDLDEVGEYAEEDGLDPPSSVAKEIAKEFIQKLVYKKPRVYDTSLWEDGDIVVYASGNGYRVSIYCRANGGASLYVNTSERTESAHHYPEARKLPFSLIVDALSKIDT